MDEIPGSILIVIEELLEEDCERLLAGERTPDVISDKDDVAARPATPSARCLPLRRPLDSPVTGTLSHALVVTAVALT